MTSAHSKARDPAMDIVDSLRSEAQKGRECIETWQVNPHLFDDAANEIERLRKQAAGNKWVTVTVERALYADRGSDVILCDREHAGPVTLVLLLSPGAQSALAAQLQEAA